MHRSPALLVLGAALVTGRAPAQEDVTHVPAQECHAGGDEDKLYFFIGHDPKEDRAPRTGYKLLLILPGGPGSRDFHPFCKRIHDNVLDDGWVTAQLVAKKWREDQRIVWPTEKSKVPEMEFSTETFIDAVIGDIEKKVRIDPRHIFTMTWSSSGPAAYAEALKKDTRVTGSFIAMSVFKPEILPPLRNGRGRAFYILHSRKDEICPFVMAQDAAEKLEKVRAKVELAEYDGGHGWPRTVYPTMKKAVDWLEDNKGKPRRVKKRG